MYSRSASKRNIFTKLVFTLVLVLVFLGSVSAACLDDPTYVEVVSGSKNMGTYPIEDINTGKIIYIKNNLDTDPLQVNFHFYGQDENCFNSTKDVMMKLFSSSLEIGAQSISFESGDTIAKFTFDLPILAPASFSSSYIVKNKDNPNGNVGLLKFGTDTKKPVFTQKASAPESSIIKQGTAIKINYAIQDSQSGLKTIVITGGQATQTITLNGNSSYSGIINEELSATTTYVIKATDMLGNQASYNKSFLVDGTNPILSNFQVKEYSTTRQGQRVVSFKVDIEDESYAYEGETPSIYGDFSELDGSATNMAGSCIKTEISKKYTCSFDNVKILKLQDTKSVSITITGKDGIGNEVKGTYSKEIFFDGTGPEISEFYLENSLGTKNIFSAYDDKVKVYLQFNDESLKKLSDISIIENFDGDNFFISSLRNCYFEGDNGNKSNNASNTGDGGDTLTGGENATSTPEEYSLFSNLGKDVICEWDLGSWVSRYSGRESGTITLSVTLRDKYGNNGHASINVSFDNQVPEITDIELIETESVKDGLVNSGEVINFRIFVQDNNLDFDTDYIYGDFSNIDYSDGMDKKGASCSAYNIDEDGNEIYQCDFEGITAENGYLKRDVTFVVIDKTANVAKETYEVEVLKVADEVRKVYKVVDANPNYDGSDGILHMLNPLNREQVKKSETTAWFEGRIELKNSADSGFELINYELISCDREGLMPIVASSNELYPDNLVQREEGETNADNKFAVKVDLSAHPNKADLNDKEITCTISVLKKDEETLYGGQIDNIEKIEFTMTFEFYNLPHEELLDARAQDILNKIDSIALTGNWFDTTWQIYEFFDKSCNTLTTINTAIAAIGGIWNGVSVILRATGYGTSVAEPIDKFLNPTDGKLSTLTKGDTGVMSYVNSFCNYMTCKTGWQKEILDIIDLGYSEVGQWAGGAVCSLAQTDGDKEEEEE